MQKFNFLIVASVEPILCCAFLLVRPSRW